MRLKYILFLFAFSFCHANDFLSVEIWYDREAFYGGEGPKLSPSLEVMQVLVEETAWILSGMIYGFNFEYNIEDPVREVEESFFLEKRGSIAYGDKDLNVYEDYLVDTREFIKAEFKMDKWQKLSREASLSQIYTAVTAYGLASYFDGYKAKIISYENGIKEAILASLRKNQAVRPRRVTGIVFLETCPVTAVKAGQYRAKVSVRFEIKEIDYKTIF